MTRPGDDRREEAVAAHAGGRGGSRWTVRNDWSLHPRPAAATRARGESRWGGVSHGRRAPRLAPPGWRSPRGRWRRWWADDKLGASCRAPRTSALPEGNLMLARSLVGACLAVLYAAGAVAQRNGAAQAAFRGRAGRRDSCCRFPPIPDPTSDGCCRSRLWICAWRVGCTWGRAPPGCRAGRGCCWPRRPALPGAADLTLMADRPEDRADALIGLGRSRPRRLRRHHRRPPAWPAAAHRERWRRASSSGWAQWPRPACRAGCRCPPGWFAQVGGLAVFGGRRLHDVGLRRHPGAGGRAWWRCWPPAIARSR